MAERGEKEDAGAAICPETASLVTEKVFDTTLDVANPIGFCADKKAYLMSELDNKFVGVCYKGALILGIKQVVSAGACTICNSNGSGQATVDVQFLAAVRVFARWDILTGVTIRNMTPMISGSFGCGAGGSSGREPEGDAAQAFIALCPPRGADALAVGLQIPVRVMVANHPPRKSAVAYCVLLTCERAAPVYRVRGALDPAAARDLMGLVGRITDELALRAELARARPAQLAFFENLLYSYSGGAGGAGVNAAGATTSPRP
ncbi:MAG: hypothetical protein EBU23_17855, partial [Mycobacteriaceae bacterium]|nr:hypothetical protein [Mycobacteriaceae bacterium]